MPRREYPESPLVGVGGVVVSDGRAVLIRRGSEPLKGEWSIPGGMLEVGETIAQGIARELREETGLEVRVLELIEVFERIFPETSASAGRDTTTAPETAASGAQLPPGRARPRYHFVILDYLCEVIGGTPRPGGDVTDVALAGEEELGPYHLSPAATRVVKKAFALARARIPKL